MNRLHAMYKYGLDDEYAKKRERAMTKLAQQDVVRVVTERASRKPWYATAAFAMFGVFGTLFGGIKNAFEGIWDWFVEWWSGVIGVGVVSVLVGLFSWWLISGITQADHYNSDFKRYCTSMFHGKAYIDDRDLCIAHGKVVMHESSNDGASDGHYDADFARYCANAGGYARMNGKDTCTRNSITIMRES